MKKLNQKELKDFLDQKVSEFNTFDFIENDPISIPKQFTDPKDIEIAAFFSSIIAWGNRKSVIKSAQKIMQLMDHSPYDFVMNSQPSDWPKESGSIHRTFMNEDFVYFIRQLNRLYQNSNSLERYFELKDKEMNVMEAISRFRSHFLEEEKEHRAKKHLSNPNKNSSAKRLNMFLRWMVREDQVDFGLWKHIPTSKLCLPLDVHTANVGRKLGLLKRKQNDRKAVEEITAKLRKIHPEDPVRYDFALFGLGVYEKF